MSKFSKNSINLKSLLAFKIIAILAFSLLILPASAGAEGGRNTTYGDFSNNNRDRSVPSDYIQTLNPKPIIFSITPNEGEKSIGGKNITINGKGFIPSSQARINGANRNTAFIDSTHLLVEANSADMYRADGGFYITVWNGEPGGGFSNSEFFTVKNVANSNASQNSNSNSNADNNYSNTNTENKSEAEEFSSLTSNAVYGSGSFLPSGIIQWILFVIIILLMIILIRKFFGGEQAYHETPLKHD
ncbi:IPT/TIG domain-containing protein [Candidatus Nomurabacteria bacterium]|nr:IPT/TIG domain-containing protein [Candidatus Nomurabacteria bacterium]